jgi:hypothetical protein
MPYPLSAAAIVHTAPRGLALMTLHGLGMLRTYSCWRPIPRRLAFARLRRCGASGLLVSPLMRRGIVRGTGREKEGSNATAHVSPPRPRLTSPFVLSYHIYSSRCDNSTSDFDGLLPGRSHSIIIPCTTGTGYTCVRSRWRSCWTSARQYVVPYQCISRSGERRGVSQIYK